MAWGGGKSAILSDRDKRFVDLIMIGNTQYDAFEMVYPEKCEGRTRKQMYKSIRDILSKPKVKEYKEALEHKADTALNNEIKSKAKKIADNIMGEEELMSLYSKIARDEDESTMNRLKAMDSLSKYLFGLDKKKVEVDGNVNSDIIINIIDEDKE